MDENPGQRHNPRRLALAAGALGGLAFAAAAAMAGPYQQEPGSPRPIVVELYTSQGCASCPPADQILAELADREDVLALTLPVDYWDYLGWRDTFARPQTSQRQVAYARRTQTGRVFTPQIVIDGVYSAIGNQRMEILARIAERRAEANLEPGVPVRIAVEGAKVSVSLPADEARRALPRPNASVWLIPFGKTDLVHITAGENRGRSVRYSHVVRNIVMLGEWSGKAATFEHALADGDRNQFGYAVLVQEEGSGPVLAATWAGDRGRMGPKAPRPEPRILADPLLVNIQQ